MKISSFWVFLMTKYRRHPHTTSLPNDLTGLLQNSTSIKNMFKVNVNVFPSGSNGFSFKNGDGVNIRANSWPGVTAKLKAYRARNGHPPGNPEAEVLSQACSRNPSLCKESQGKAVLSAKKPPSLKGRVLSWLSTLKKTGEAQPLTFVKEPEMKARANVCATCHHNKPLPDGCSSCKMAISELRKNLIGQQRLNGQDHRINACEALGCDLPSAAWLDEPRIRHDGLPANCWRKINP
jgi:hypothetical protein